MMEWLAYIGIGFSGFVTWKVLWFLYRVIRIAFQDAMLVSVMSGSSKLMWVIVIPLVFLTELRSAACDELRGYYRVL